MADHEEKKTPEISDDIYDISAAEETKKWAWLSNIHPLMIVFGIIVLVSLATYIIPGGQYERYEVAIEALGGDTRELIVPGSFHFAESVPQGFSKIWTSFMVGAMDAADISFTIFLCAGAFTAIIATGAVTNGINTLAKRFGTKAYVLIPICIFVFGLGGATYGMYEDSIPFVLVLVPLALAMGFDSMTGLMTVHFAVAVGASSAFMNPFTVGVGQALAEVPMMSGIGVRIGLWIVMMAATSAYVLRYAFKVKKNPLLSSCYETDLQKRKDLAGFNTDDLKGLSFRDGMVLITLAASMGLMVYGVIEWGWWFNEIGSIFIFMGVIIPLIGGMKIGEVINQNIEGMTTVISAVLLISASRVITAILTDSNTMDTILFYMSNTLVAMPKIFSVVVMFLVSSIAMLFIQSSSGLAATLMPIMAPLGDLLGISRQTVVSAYALGSGAFGWIVPWEGVNFAMCSLAGVAFFKYLKEAAKFVFTVYIPISIIGLVLMTLLNYG
ncbi:MAG: hypothetical protein RR495_05930 [Anaerovoracaceae bacterium]